MIATKGFLRLANVERQGFTVDIPEREPSGTNEWGIRQDYHVRVTRKQVGNVEAVFLDGFSDMSLDSEWGAGISIEVEDVKRWMADYRHSEWWCRPEFGTAFTQVPEETQLLIYEKTDGTYGVIVPVVSEQYKCVLAGTEEGLVAKLFSWYEGLTACKGLAFLWGEGENPHALIEECVREAMKLLNHGCRMRTERRYPELFEYLGWCSWDAFEIRVDEESLVGKCQEFQDKNIPIRWVILDDMWAEVRDFYGMEYKNRSQMCHLMHSSRLYSFGADPYRFPNGLKGCIDRIKSYGLKVGMWHPTTGYWMGLDPQGDAFRQVKEHLIHTVEGSWVHGPEQEKAYGFYNAFHDYLQGCGAEFVKIDHQSMSRRFFKKLGPVGQVARSYHKGMEASVGQHFDNQLINCMGMASEDMWNRNISPISRCSDDFMPENREWFTKHILQCAYNSLIHGQFYYCDWDMWWTDDGQAVKNSVLRAISGGPIYVSDTAGRSRGEVLKPLAFEDGRILRCDRPAMPARDCLTEDPVHGGRIFKVQNLCNGCGVIAVFNLDEEEKPVSGRISAGDVEGLSGREFGVYEHFSGEFRVIGAEEAFDLTLENAEAFKLYILVPLQNGCGMIGRTDKYISPASVRTNCRGTQEPVENGPYAYVENYKLIKADRY